MNTAQRPPSTRPGPEAIGIILAVIIYVVVGATIVVAIPRANVVSTPTPTATPVSVTPRPVATLDPSLILLLRDGHARIIALGDELKALIAIQAFDTTEVVSKIREISRAVTFTTAIVDRLRSQPGGEPIAATLRAAYDEVRVAAGNALSAALPDRASVRTDARAVVAKVAALPDIDLLLAAPPATPAPTPVPTPTSSIATPTATPPSPPPSQGTPQPTGSSSATPPPGGPNRLVNGDFEAGLNPWQLVPSPGTTGTVELTGDGAFAGTASALVTVTRGTGPGATASIQQGNLTLESGVTYTVSLAVRSTTTRDFRVRLTTAQNGVISSRILSASPTWTTVAFALTPIGRLEGVTLQIEAGAPGQQLWLDDVAIR